MEVQDNQAINVAHKMVVQVEEVLHMVQEMMVRRQAISQANQANQVLLVMDFQDIQVLAVAVEEEQAVQELDTQQDLAEVPT